jgi:heparan-alpha-glucosaminide N-acetyltransferase
MDSQTNKPPRITSIDAYRGLVMLLMMAAGMALYNVPKHKDFEASIADRPEWVRTVWQTVAFHTNHVKWSGCSLHDMIQPSFSFLVGVALPFSLASRQAKGQGFWKMLLHAAFRALLLIALGVFLRSTHATQTNFTFEDTLSQIGLGYVFLFLLGFVRPAWQWAAFAVIVVGYWALFALWPLPPEGFDPTTVGVKPDWDQNYVGFFAHWNINTNPAAGFDRWFLNLFGREKEFVGNGGGYATLSFIPTLGTMILGLIAGNWMKAGLPRKALWLRLFAAGVILTAAGLGAEMAGLCPIVKPIWTPAWTLYSGGICFLFLLGFTLLFDNGSPLRVLAFPLVVIGANSIFIYCAYHLTGGWVKETLKIHLALPEKTWHFKTYEVFGTPYETAVRGALVILIFWLVLLWMYRKRIFVKI